MSTRKERKLLKKGKRIVKKAVLTQPHKTSISTHTQPLTQPFTIAHAHALDINALEHYQRLAYTNGWKDGRVTLPIDCKFESISIPSFIAAVQKLEGDARAYIIGMFDITMRGWYTAGYEAGYGSAKYKDVRLPTRPSQFT